MRASVGMPLYQCFVWASTPRTGSVTVSVSVVISDAPEPVDAAANVVVEESVDPLAYSRRAKSRR